MTSITIDLEDRYKRLTSSPDDTDPETKLSLDTDLYCSDYSRNYGFYVSTRYTTRLVSLAFSIYYCDKINMTQVFAIYCCVTLALLLFVVVYFQELKVNTEVIQRKYGRTIKGLDFGEYW